MDTLKLKCVNNAGWVGYLTEGKVYKGRASMPYYSVVPDNGSEAVLLSTSRFEVVTEEVPGGSTAYYKLPPDAKELGDLIEHKNMNFNVGNIFKAAYRLGEKDTASELYDLNKIVWFANREITRLEKNNA